MYTAYYPQNTKHTTITCIVEDYPNKIHKIQQYHTERTTPLIMKYTKYPTEHKTHHYHTYEGPTRVDSSEDVNLCRLRTEEREDHTWGPNLTTCPDRRAANTIFRTI